MFCVKKFCFVVLFLFCSAYSRIDSIVPLFESSNVLVEPYGIAAHITRSGSKWDYDLRYEELQRLKSIGVNWIRADASHGLINSTQTGNRLYVVDSVLKSIDDYGLNFLPILDRKSSKGFAWDDFNEYGKYLDSVARRFSPKIHYWEAMNEAGRIKNVSSLDEKYLAALKRIYETLKTADSANKVLLTGITGVNGSFAESLYARNASEYFDIMNFHTYNGVKSLQHILIVLHEEMKKYKWNKPVWITECGLHTARDSLNQKRGGNLIEQKQAERLPQSFLLAFAYGVDKMFWYNLRSTESNMFYSEDNYGILHRDLSPKPAFSAYKTLITMCPSGSSRPVLKQKGDFFIASWIKPDKTKMFAAWVREGVNKKFRVKPTGNGLIFNIYGLKMKSADKISNSIMYFANFDSVKFD